MSHRWVRDSLMAMWFAGVNGTPALLTDSVNWKVQVPVAASYLPCEADFLIARSIGTRPQVPSGLKPCGHSGGGPNGGPPGGAGVMPDPAPTGAPAMAPVQSVRRIRTLPMCPLARASSARLS